MFYYKIEKTHVTLKYSDLIVIYVLMPVHLNVQLIYTYTYWFKGEIKNSSYMHVNQ